MGAIDLYARPSKTFDEKLAKTEALLRLAAADYGPVTQASSLGAEDVVITHLINRLELDIPVFVLETGALHPQTLELLRSVRRQRLLRCQQRLLPRCRLRCSEGLCRGLRSGLCRRCSAKLLRTGLCRSARLCRSGRLCGRLRRWGCPGR